MSNIMVRDLMTEPVRTLHPEDSLATVYDLLDTQQVRHAPVVDEAGNLVGLVTQRDLLRKIPSDQDDLPGSLRRDILRRLTVEEVLTESVETIVFSLLSLLHLY